MAGMKRHGLLALAIILGSGAAAQAFGRGLFPWNWGSNYSSYGRSSGCYSTPVWCSPAYGGYAYGGYGVPVSQAALPQGGMPLARPVAAPPSEKIGAATKEPPAANKTTKALKAPVITESRSMGGVYASAAGERCKVGFWNVSGQDITIKVDGEALVLAKNRAVTLELARTFVWQIDQREPNAEQVPTDQLFHEVIIRQ